MNDKDGFFDGRGFIEAIRDQDVIVIKKFISGGYRLEDMIIFAELIPHLIPDVAKREECLKIYRRCVKMYMYGGESE